MLLSEGVQALLPEWAFFVRCVVDASELRPTASREALYEDSLLEHVREALGERLRSWLAQLGTTDPQGLAAFIRIHDRSLKAVAVHDDEMLRLVHRWCPFETNVGPLTLDEFHDRYGVVRFTDSVDEFRQIAHVAAAQGIPLVNAGYVYEQELVTRLPSAAPGTTVERLSPADLSLHLAVLPADDERRVASFVGTAQRRLDRQGVRVVVRAFDPPSLPALYLLDGEAALHMDMRRVQGVATDAFAAVFDAFTPADDVRPQLMFNHRNPLARQAMGSDDEELVGFAVEGLYAQALLVARQPLTPAATAAMNQSLIGLLSRAMGAGR